MDQNGCSMNGAVHEKSKEKIVISGLAGTYPKSLNLQEFQDNLFSKKDLITKQGRWTTVHPDLPSYCGNLPVINKFDAGFFGISSQQATVMEPNLRMLLEKTFEAILDAGIHPSELKGSNTGVYIASCFMETEEYWLNQNSNVLTISGCSRLALANRISYYLGLNGPSYPIDSACSGSLYLIDQACQAIRSGQCDMAIVGGCNLCLHPVITMQFGKLGALSYTGKSRCFDVSADGYTRAECVSVVILQKAKDARRIYCEVVHIKSSSDGFKDQGIHAPSADMQIQLLSEFYSECEIDPVNVTFFEAHASGTPVGDPEELNSLETIFCSKKRKPLWIGSVKSNIGNAEPVSGLCSLTKVITIMETGYLVPNIYFDTPRKECKALRDGDMKVVTEKIPWDGGYCAIDNFGLGGTNAHMLVKPNTKEKFNFGIPTDDMPRLVYCSGRTKEAVDTIVNHLLSKSLDAEFVRLLHEIYKYDIPGHNYRAYTILDKNGKISSEVENYCYDKKGLWLVLSGIGSNWCNAVKDFMCIPQFVKTLKTCYDVFKEKNIHVVKYLSKKKPTDESKLSDICVALTSIQIAMLQLLKSIHITPTGLVSYSIGEIACAYYENYITLEEAILCSYYTGKYCEECKESQGSMILVKAKSEAIKNLLTPGLEIMTISTTENNIVSGDSTKMEEFIKKLKIKSISYKELISDFEDNFNKIPTDAIVFELSPYNILQDILKRLSIKVPFYYSLLSESSNGLEAFLDCMGKLYNMGYNPRIENIYPKISYPVSRGTSSLSSLIKWDHSRDWFVPIFELKDIISYENDKYSVSLNSSEYDFLTGNLVNERSIFPVAGYLMIVWKTLASIREEQFEDVSIVFEELKLHRATALNENETVVFTVTIQKISGHFEVVEKDTVVVTGRVYIPDVIDNEISKLPIPILEKKDTDIPLLSKQELRKEFRLRGHDYSDIMCGFQSCDDSYTIAQVEWKNNWITFISTVFQMRFIAHDLRDVFILSGVHKLIINMKKHNEIVKKLSKHGTIPMYNYKQLNTIICGGVEMRGLEIKAVARKKDSKKPVVETYQFIPNILEQTNFNLKQCIRLLLHLVIENYPHNIIKTVEVIENNKFALSNIISPIIVESLNDWTIQTGDQHILTTESVELEGITVSNKSLASESNCVIVIVSNICKNPQVLKSALNATVDNGFVIARERLDTNLSEIELNNFILIADYKLKSERLILLSKPKANNSKCYVNITDVDNKFDWIPNLQNALKHDSNPCFYSQGDDESGILGFYNCIRHESGAENVSCVFIMDQNALQFDPNHQFYAKQIEKNMAVNVLKNGQWGTYRHLLIDKNSTIDTKHAILKNSFDGELNTLIWKAGQYSKDINTDYEQLLVHVYYSGMYIRDMMVASGQILEESRFEEPALGQEFAGKLNNGRRVIGVVAKSAASNLIYTKPNLIWDVPNDWSLEDAATVPLAYGIALYAVVTLAKIKPGMSILIHSSANDIQQAAIHIALHYNCSVYVTVDNFEKQEFIKTHWPQMNDNHIINIKTVSLEQTIMRETNGRGVDITLISFTNDLLIDSIHCVASGGSFVGIGLVNLYKNFHTHISIFANDISFHNFMVDSFACLEKLYIQKIGHLIKEHFKSGAIKPLVKHVFEEHDIENMFSLMTAENYMGKILLKIREEEVEKNVKPSYKLLKAVPQCYFTNIHSQIVVGGFGGFGLELIDWLITRGARKIVICSRKGISTGYQAMRMRVWNNYGVEIIISTENIATYDGCKRLIQQAIKLGPVESIFNVGVIIKDGLFVDQNKRDFDVPFGVKAYATKYLDEISRDLCPDLKEFVVFSSHSSGRGNKGITNYGMANSIMERICEKRKENGLPAVAVQWGSLADVGLVAEIQDKTYVQAILAGTLPQKVISCLAVLEELMCQTEPLCSSMLIADKIITETSATNISDAILEILGITNIKSISEYSTLAELGMDSIMGVEIQQTLERKFNVLLTPRQIRTLTFARLQEITLEQNVSEGS